MTVNAIAESILTEALVTASTARYCKNCSLCYIRPDDEMGYCKYEAWGYPVGVPMVVNEWYSCPHWERKNPKAIEANTYFGA